LLACPHKAGFNGGIAGAGGFLPTRTWVSSMNEMNWRWPASSVEQAQAL
jgi:hypothetical protein